MKTLLNKEDNNQLDKREIKLAKNLIKIVQITGVKNLNLNHNQDHTHHLQVLVKRIIVVKAKKNNVEYFLIQLLNYKFMEYLPI